MKVLYVYKNINKNHNIDRLISKFILYSKIFIKHGIELMVYENKNDLFMSMSRVTTKKKYILLFNDEIINDLIDIDIYKIIYIEDPLEHNLDWINNEDITILSPNSLYFEELGMKNVYQFNYIIDEMWEIDINVKKKETIGNLHIESMLFDKIELSSNSLDNIKKIRNYESFLLENTDIITYTYIEVLFSGTIPIFEKNNYLDKLGIKEYIHYIPCEIENDEIKNMDEIIEYLTSENSKKIPKNAQSYILEHFSANTRIFELINIINKESFVYYQNNMYSLLNLLKLGKSFIRYSDGEFTIIGGKGVSYQKVVKEEMTKKLIDILENKNENLCIGLGPFYFEYTDFHFETDKKKENIYYANFYNKYANELIIPYLKKDTVYYDQLIFRPYLQKKYQNLVYSTLNQIIVDKRVCIVSTNEISLNLSLVSDFLKKTKSTHFIHTTPIDAFKEYHKVKKEIEQIIENIDIIFICVDSLKCLIGDFKDIQCIDLSAYFRFFRK